MRPAFFLLCAAACSVHVVFDDQPDWVDQNHYPPIGDGKILVTNNGSDSLSWIDVGSLEPVLTEPVGRIPAEREGPHHGAASPDGTTYFVGLSNFVPGSGNGPHGSHGNGTVPGYLLSYATSTHELVGVTQLDRSPGDVRATADGRFVLASHFDLRLIQEVVTAGGTLDDMRATLAIIDPSQVRADDVNAGLIAKVPVCPAPHGIRPSADSRLAYLACWGSDELAIVALDPPYAVEKFHMGSEVIDPTRPSHAPYALTVSPRDGSIWVSNQGATGANSGDVRVFDPATRAWDAARGVVQTGGIPFFGDFTADGALLVMPNQLSNTLSFIDGPTGAIRSTFDLPRDDCVAPHAVLVTPDQAQVVVVCEGDHLTPGRVAVVALSPPRLVSSFAVGIYPDDAILLKSP